MVQDEDHHINQAKQLVSLETFGQRADSVPHNSLNTRVHYTQVNYCKENTNFEESSPDLFTQPRNMFDKQNHINGGFQVCREKQKAALVSEPIDDQGMHDNYQNSNLDLEETPFRFKKRTCAENLSEFHGKVFDESQDSSFGYLETSRLDIKFGARRNANAEKFVNEPWSANENHNFVCDNEFTRSPSNDEITRTANNGDFTRTANEASSNNERHFSDDLSLSSQEFAAVINKSLIPKTEQEANVTRKNMNSSSKWEKYESQHSEDDVNLDIDAVKVKIKDFSVIEKPMKTETVILPGKQINLCTTQHTDVLNERNQRSMNTQHTQCSATNDRRNLNNRLVPQLAPVRGETMIHKATHTNPVTQVSKSENSKLPSSFSSLDSFEQMLANDNLDFSDPELEKLLQTQTNIDKIEEKLIDLSPGSSNPNENSSDALDIQNDPQSGIKKVIKCSSENVSPMDKKDAIDSFEEKDQPSNSSGKKELHFTPCDKNETSQVENFMADIENSLGDNIHENDDMKAIECDTNAAEICDIGAVENCDRRMQDSSDCKQSKTNNDNHTGVKSLSSESETSFSLDDSFITANHIEANISTKTSNEPTVSLRAPWKENLKVSSTNSKSAIKESVTKSHYRAIDKHITNENSSAMEINEHHKSAITQSSKTNIDTDGNVTLGATENRSHDREANFMGYDSYDNDIEGLFSGDVNEITEKTEIGQTERERIFSKTPQNKKDNMFSISNSCQQKTDSNNSLNQPPGSVKAGVRSVSSQFKNPFKRGETSQQTANQGNRATKRLVKYMSYYFPMLIYITILAFSKISLCLKGQNVTMAAKKIMVSEKLK